MADRIALFSSALSGWDARRVTATAAALGIGAVEWGVGPGQALAGPPDGARASALCADAGLAVAGLAVQDAAVTLATPRPAARHVALAAAIGSPHVRFFAPVYERGSPGAARRRARAGVDALVEAGAASAVAILVETAPGTLAPSPELALSLVEHQPPSLAGVLYDPGNTVIEGLLAPALAVSLLGRHLRHVHVKNIYWARTASGSAWRYADLDRGAVAWPAVVAALDAARYRGRLSIDHLARRPTVAALGAETQRLREIVAGDGGRR